MVVDMGKMSLGEWPIFLEKIIAAEESNFLCLSN